MNVLNEIMLSSIRYYYSDVDFFLALGTLYRRYADLILDRGSIAYLFFLKSLMSESIFYIKQAFYNLSVYWPI
jgi:hypothetical protein